MRWKRERKQIQTRTEELQGKRNTLVQADRHAEGQGRGYVRGDGGSGRYRRRAESLCRATGRSCRRDISEFMLAHSESAARIGAGRQRTRPAMSRCARSARRAASISRCKDHVDVGAALGLDFDVAAKMTGSRFCGDEGRHRTPAPRAGAIHARYAYRRAWLYRMLYAVYRQCRFAARHRPVAEVRGRSVRGEEGRPGRRGRGAVPDSDRRSAADQYRAR